MATVVLVAAEDRPRRPPEGVVDQQQATLAEPRHELGHVVEVRRLVGVDEGDVEALLDGEGPQRVEARAEAELDPVADAGLVPVPAADRRPLLAHVEAEEPAVGRQGPGHGEGRVSGERADLDGLPGAHERHEHGHEGALVRADLIRDRPPVRSAFSATSRSCSSSG